MPTMMEIYEKHAPEYAELVGAEDYERRLPAALLQIAKWDAQSVFEAGTGTGRVTEIYIDAVKEAYCCDRSSHMLDFAKERLAAFASKLSFGLADNLNLPSHGNADIFIEGWSFGHSVTADPDHVPETTTRLVAGALGTLKPDGIAIFIETMGTNTEAAGAPHPALAEFYRLLEQKHGFSNLTVRTDYNFASVEEAARITGFFFGPNMGETVAKSGSSIVREWTGLWYRSKV